ncbi:HlyD family secretion protein [Acetivibrio clariflavus]|uniref:HlyD family secretion protein n=1 Tax=Acetivibrio clariflavus TaxID=288965 RepID=UPI0004813585|nr:efflux RND transporter periplasmic adaptor subunit [Acetivibrio clariflavus]
MKRIFILGVITIMLLTGGCSKNEIDTGLTINDTGEFEETVDVFGVVKANDVKDLFIDFPVLIEDIHVKEGQKVKKGDAIITINYEDYKNQIKSKEIELYSLKRELENSQLELENNQQELIKLQKDLHELQDYLSNGNHSDLVKLSNDLDNANSDYEASLKELKINEELLKKGAISQDELDSYKKKVDNYKKQVINLEAALKKCKNDLQKEVDNLKLSIKQKSELIENCRDKSIYEDKLKYIENSIKLMNDKVNKSYIIQNTIVSDVDNAIVYGLNCVKGESVQNSKRLFSLVNINSIVVEANVPEEFINDIKLNSEVTIIPQADKTKEYKGKVTYISNIASSENGETTVMIEANIDNNDGFLMPNFNVDLKISKNKS